MLGCYYEERFPGKFENQKLLDTLISTAACKLSCFGANPLTVRLLIANDCLLHYKNAIDLADDKYSTFKVELITDLGPTPLYSNDWFDYIQPVSSGSAVTSTMGAVKNVPSGVIIPPKYNQNNGRIYPQDESTVFRNIIAHIELFSFFSNFGSILDRFSHEINFLFDLKINKIDWGILTGRTNNKKHLLAIQNKKSRYNALFNLVAIFDGTIAEKCIRFRNRFIHDGLINIQPRIVSDHWVIYIQDDPDQNQSPVNTNSLSFCRDSFSELITFLNSTYGEIITILKTNGQPPW